MIRPLSNRIVVEPIQGEGQTPSGLYVPLPKTTFTKSGKPEVQITVGRVLAVGPGKDHKKGRRPPDVKLGEVVTFSDTCGAQVKVDGKMYRIIREDDIVGYTDEKTAVEVVYRFDDSIDVESVPYKEVVAL